MGLAEPLEQLTKGIVKHTPVGKAASEFVQKTMPDLHYLLTGAENVKVTGTRRAAHPRAFSSSVDFQGAINSGRLQNYTETLPKAWQHNFAKHYNDLDPDGRADFTDLIVRAANDEAPAKMSVMQTARTLDVAQQADMRQAKARRTVQQNTIPPEAQWPNKYDVKGKEGKKFVETKAKSWFDEKLDSIGWDPERTGEINRGEFASEGIYIDMGQGAEKYNFGGLTKYAKDRKTIPRLTKASQSEAQLNRLSSEVSQTFGPAFRAKPELVDQLGEVVPPKKVHKHHVLLLKVIEPFTMLTGGRTRSRKDMKYIFDGLAKRDWWIGNTDKNLVWQRIQTHIEDMFGSHGQLKGMTDIQGRPKGEKFIEGFGPTEIPGKTYDPKARHGFSEQFIEEIQKEKDPKVVLAKLLMFLEEGGGGEAMEGAAYSAQKAMEPRAVIKQTGKIKDVKSGDIVADRRLQNPRIQQNVERFEKGTANLRKGG